MKKSKRRKIWHKIVEIYKKDPDEEAEEEEFEEFLSKCSKRMSKLTKHFGIIRGDSMHMALLVQNVYTQKKMVEANNSLKIATWILALATISLTIGTVYGVTELNNTLRIWLQFLIGILVLALALWTIKGFYNFIKFIWKLFK